MIFFEYKSYLLSGKILYFVTRENDEVEGCKKKIHIKGGLETGKKFTAKGD